MFGIVEIPGWQNHVRETRNFLDSRYTVNIGPNISAIVDTDYQLGWGRIGCEKFYDRIIPGVDNENFDIVAVKFKKATQQAVEFGNASLVVSTDGTIRIPAPESSGAYVDALDNVHYHEALGELQVRSVNGIVESKKISENDKKWKADPTTTVFTIFYKQDAAHPFGQSRITPAIRKSIRSASRSKMRAEIASNYRTYPMVLFNGLWEDLASNVAQGITKLKSGVSNVLGLPKDPDTGEKISVESIPQADFTPFLKLRESYAADVAAAFNIDPQELGIQSIQPSSADAIFASKEDLVVEIEAFTREIKPVFQRLVNYLASLLEIEAPKVYFAEPATPSKASQADAFTKLAVVVPQLKYSAAAMRWAGLPQDVIDDIAMDDFELEVSEEVVEEDGE